MFEKTMTPYQYAYQNPVKYTDSTGMMPYGGPPHASTSPDDRFYDSETGTEYKGGPNGGWSTVESNGDVVIYGNPDRSRSSSSLAERLYSGENGAATTRLQEAIRSNSATRDIDKIMTSAMSFVPGADALELLNAYDDYENGDYWGAAFSTLAAIPIVGKFAKLGKFGGKIAIKEGRKFTKSSLSLGREIHKGYKLAEHAPELGRFKEFTGIKGIRPDFVDFGTKTIYELKPFNPRGIRMGTQQLNKYKSLFEKNYGGTWKTVLDFY